MPGEAPVVTIVTPTFNQARFLPATIESVLAQTHPAIEYVVIDDGSTDTTPEVLSRYADRVTVRRQENVGQARTLNRGWADATGKYLAYLSSDDLLEPDCIASMVQALEAHPTLVCAFPDCDLIDEYGSVIKRRVCRPFSLTDLVVLQECHVGPGAVFRRDAFEQAGGWRPDLKLAPDREFWIRMSRFGAFHFEPQPLAKYRLHRNSISVQVVSEEVSREFLRVLDDYYADAPASDCLARKREAYGRANFVLARNAFRAHQMSRGWRYYREACRLHPPLAGLDAKASLLRNVISKPVRLLASKLRNGTRRTSR